VTGRTRRRASRVLRAAAGAIALSAVPATVSHGQEDAGKGVYTRVCQMCHGAEGHGDAGPSLVPLEKEYEEVLGIVREGTGQMPPIAAERVSDDDVKRIVAYLKSLKRGS
jgi:mono/diheme cytochrome c family protein